MSMLLKIPEYNVLINILILNIIINVMKLKKEKKQFKHDIRKENVHESDF